MEPLSIAQILSACSKIMENAQELIEEAELLLQNNRYARAFTLAHLASEELMKFTMLLPVAFELARNRNVDWKTIGKHLTNHIVKTRGSILIDFLRAPAPDGVYQAGELSQQMSAAEDINDLKNYSLYTSQIGAEFFKPSERFDRQSAEACVLSVQEQFQIAQMFYLSCSTLTGWTEEGLRDCVETPVFQELFQALGSNADLSHFPKMKKQQSIEEMTALFNDPAFQPLLTLFPTAVGEILHSPDRDQGGQPTTSSETDEPIITESEI